MEVSKTNTLSFYNDQGVLTISAKQYDTGRKFIFNIINDYELCDLTGYSVYLRMRKADKTEFQGEECCSIDGSKVIVDTSISNGNQILSCPGMNLCELHLTDSDGKSVTTWNFIINVEARVHNGDGILSKDSWDMMDTIESTVKDFNKKLDEHYFVLTSDKDIANGVPSLDANKKIPSDELPVASTTLGGVKSGTDITVDADGNVSVNDDSHKHKLNNISDVTATASELNVLDGITASTTELNYTDGVKSNIQDQLDDKAPLASPELTGIPKAPTASAGTNTTQIATTAFVQTAVSEGIAASDALIFKGLLGTTGTITALPTTYRTGWTYRVVTNGTYAGQVCEIGDLIIALVDRNGSGNLDSDWCVAQTNIDGAITGIKSGDAYIEISQSGSVVTIKHKDVTRTNTTSTAKPSHGGTFTAVKSVTSDAKGHVTGVDTETVTLPTYGVATQSANGLESAADKTKLDGIEAGAQVNTITGVKGNSESSYRTGNVNITPENIGLGNVQNVTTNDQTPSYTEATTLAKLTSGEKLSVAFGKISKAVTDLISHLADTVKHITSSERTNWNTAYTHSQSAHAPSNAQANQNAFSNVVVGSTTVAADTTTDTLTLVAGSNMTLTPDATNDKITIASAHPTVTTSTDTTSTASPSAGGTFTTVDSVTRDSNGHVTKVNTKTVTLPNTAVTVDSTLSSTSTNPVQNKVVNNALNKKIGTTDSLSSNYLFYGEGGDVLMADAYIASYTSPFTIKTDVNSVHILGNVIKAHETVMKGITSDLKAVPFDDSTSTYSTLSAANSAAETTINNIKNKVSLIDFIKNTKQSFSAIIQGLKILGTNVGAISGITDSLTATSSNVALSAKGGNNLQGQINTLNSNMSSKAVKNNIPYGFRDFTVSRWTETPDSIDNLPDGLSVRGCPTDEYNYSDTWYYFTFYEGGNNDKSYGIQFAFARQAHTLVYRYKQAGIWVDWRKLSI